MPTFCRHNRFIERCPICSRTLPGAEPVTGGGRRSAREARAGAAGGVGGARGSSTTGRHRRLPAGGRAVRVHREVRAQDDGYSSDLAPGLHASADAARLAEEIAFAGGRLLRMHTAPPDLFDEIRRLAGDGQLERATWMCFLTVYLSPLQIGDPFVGIRAALDREREVGRGDEDERVGESASEGASRQERGIPSLEGIPLGPRTSHDPARGSETLLAYRHWAVHSGGTAAGGGGQAQGIIGEESWTPQRRFERAFERLALPGFGRMGRYELLVTLGRLGLYELEADSLHLAAGRGPTGLEDLTTVAAKRILAVGDPIYLERRAVAFAQELWVPVDVLDLAFANWGSGERATLGFGSDTIDAHTHERVREALGLPPISD
ncbi:MAG: hypothetical protein ACLP7W_13350 [Solirubrobacteraceae bacterium]